MSKFCPFQLSLLKSLQPVHCSYSFACNWCCNCYCFCSLRAALFFRFSILSRSQGSARQDAVVFIFSTLWHLPSRPAYTWTLILIPSECPHWSSCCKRIHWMQSLSRDCPWAHRISQLGESQRKSLCIRCESGKGPLWEQWAAIMPLPLSTFIAIFLSSQMAIDFPRKQEKLALKNMYVFFWIVPDTVRDFRPYGVFSFPHTQLMMSVSMLC